MKVKLKDNMKKNRFDFAMHLKQTALVKITMHIQRTSGQEVKLCGLETENYI